MLVGSMAMRASGILAGSLLLSAVLAAGQTGTTWSGVYSAAQAMEGEGLFLDRCAECHQPDLSGGEDAPALAGAQFSAKWNGRPLAQLFTLMSRTMPQNAPGSLSPAECAAVLAHVLERNGFPQGAMPLPSDAAALATVTFTAGRP